MNQARDNLVVRASEIVRTLQSTLPRNKRAQAFVGALKYHTAEIDYAKRPRAKYRYGVELEMEFKYGSSDILHAMAIVVRNLLRSTLGNNMYSVQQDSSLECGFEVITAPLSLQALKKLQILYDDKDLMKCLSAYSDNAGLHITVDPFPTREQERRFLDYFNHYVHIKDLEKVFGRFINRYSQFRPLRYGLRVVKDHNYTVHIRKNRAFEVRLFKSPYTWDEFCRRLMLVHKVNRLVRETDLSIDEIHKKVKRGLKQWLT